MRSVLLVYSCNSEPVPDALSLKPLADVDSTVAGVPSDKAGVRFKCL